MHGQLKFPRKDVILNLLYVNRSFASARGGSPHKLVQECFIYTTELLSHQDQRKI